MHVVSSRRTPSRVRSGTTGQPRFWGIQAVKRSSTIRVFCKHTSTILRACPSASTTHNAQRTTDNGQRTTDNGQRTTHNAQRVRVKHRPSQIPFKRTRPNSMSPFRGDMVHSTACSVTAPRMNTMRESSGGDTTVSTSRMGWRPNAVVVSSRSRRCMPRAVSADRGCPLCIGRRGAGARLRR
jgi:hypothetical protein